MCSILVLYHVTQFVFHENTTCACPCFFTAPHILFRHIRYCAKGDEGWLGLLPRTPEFASCSKPGITSYFLNQNHVFDFCPKLNLSNIELVHQEHCPETLIGRYQLWTPNGILQVWMLWICLEVLVLIQLFSLYRQSKLSDAQSDLDLGRWTFGLECQGHCEWDIS